MTIGAAALALAALFLATEARAEKNLRVIMGELAANTEAITRAIGNGDLEEIERNARMIAEHDKPPIEERKRILGFLKEEAAGFKGADEFVHDSAQELAESASAGDFDGVLENFRNVLEGCVRCHTGYRERIIERFRGE